MAKSSLALVLTLMPFAMALCLAQSPQISAIRRETYDFDDVTPASGPAPQSTVYRYLLLTDIAIAPRGPRVAVFPSSPPNWAVARVDNAAIVPNFRAEYAGSITRAFGVYALDAACLDSRGSSQGGIGCRITLTGQKLFGGGVVRQTLTTPTESSGQLVRFTLDRGFAGNLSALSVTAQAVSTTSMFPLQQVVLDNMDVEILFT